MTKQSELTDVEKGAILALKLYFSYSKIGAKLGRARTTIADFFQRYQKRNSIDNLPRPGRPRILSDASNRLLVRNAESETRVPFKDLKNVTNIDVSEQTIRRRLREAGIRKWRAIKRPFIDIRTCEEAFSMGYGTSALDARRFSTCYMVGRECYTKRFKCYRNMGFSASKQTRKIRST